MSYQARLALFEAEKEARKSILLEFQNLQARLKIKFRQLLSEIEAEKAKTGSVSKSFLFERSRLATLLVDVSGEIKKISGALAQAVEKAQSSAVKIAADDTERLIQTHSNQDQIVRFNPQAVKELIGNTQTGTPLTDFLARLPAPITEAVKNALIDGAANGESSSKVAADLNTVLGTGAAQTLTIARTEQNQAFRQAAVSQYRDNSEIVKGYIWISACDLRTCPICWSRHGHIYPLDRKPQSHPNCRCTSLPYIEGMELPETGISKFAKLTAAQRKTILGEKRAALYDQGLELSEFVAERKTVYGQTPYIVNLADLPKAQNGKKKPGTEANKPAPKVEKIRKEQTGPAIIKTSADAVKALQEIESEFSARIAIHRSAGEKAEKEYFDLLRSRSGLIDQGADADEIARQMRELAARKIEEFKLAENLSEEQRAKGLQIVKVENPTNLKVEFKSSFTKAEEQHINDAVSQFKNLVSDQYLDNQTFTYWKTRSNRSFYGLKNDVHLSKNRLSGRDGAAVVIHETAHGLESLNKDILDSAVAFWEYRTKGEKLERLASLTGIRGYGSEKAKKDQFKHPYDGKEPYTQSRMVDGKYQTEIVATEIITRGMEYLFLNPAQFAAEQPEYFDFIFRVLRGEKWSKS